MSTPSAGYPPDEPWELEIGSLLRRLPEVEPPIGFVDAALDHPPRHAGRTLGLLVSATLAAFALAVVGTGPASVVPPVDDLLARHETVARAGLVADAPGRGSTVPAAPVVELPEGFRPAGGVTIEDLRQAIYARGDQSVSVFVQEAPVDWNSLPAAGMTELDGLPAWVDPDRRVAILEVDGVAVTIVGLSAEQLGPIAGPRLESARPSVVDDLADLTETVVEQLGFTVG